MWLPMVEGGSQTSIEVEIVTGIEAVFEVVTVAGTVVGVGVGVEVVPKEQHSCFGTPSQDFQDKVVKDRDSLVHWRKQVPDACCRWMEQPEG